MGTFVHGGAERAAGSEHPPHCHRDGQHDCKAHTQGDHRDIISQKLNELQQNRTKMKEEKKRKVNDMT